MKSSATSVPGRRVGKSLWHTPDSQIDFSDTPEVSNEQLKHMRRVGRPATGMTKQLIAIGLSPRLLATLRKMAAKQSKRISDLDSRLVREGSLRSRVTSTKICQAKSTPDPLCFN